MKFLLLLCLTSLLLCGTNTWADTKSTVNKWAEFDKDTASVLDLIAVDKLKEALDKADEMQKKKHDIASYDCLRAAILYKIGEEYRSRQFEEDFQSSIKRSVALLEDESKDAARGNIYKAKRLQFLGSAYGYRGMYRSLEGLWASAFFDGKRGYGVLEESLVLDPTLIDNKAGMGTYLYWRSAKAGVVKYLLFWGDKKKEGIADLRSVIVDGIIVKQWALGGLLRIYIEERDWPTALEYAVRILNNYPTDSGTLRRKAMVLYMLGRKEESLKVMKDELFPLFVSKDNTILYKNKKLNTANAQIETIYHILKMNKELDEKFVDADTKKKYLSDIESLKKRVTKSFADIDGYLQKIKDMQ